MSDHPKIQGPKVALVAPVALIEACLATPAFRAIQNAKPELSLVLVCPETAEAVWRPYFKEILTYDETASLPKIMERLAGASFQSAILLEESKAARATAKIDVPQRIGIDLPTLAKLVTVPISLVEPLGPLRHRVARFLDFADALGCEGRRMENFAIPALPVTPKIVRIGFAPDSELGSAAEWPLEHFRALAGLLLQSHEVTFLPVSLPGAGPAAASLAGSIEGLDDSATANESLGALLTTLSELSLLVASDGAIPNLAAHIGLPTITLMGPRARDVHRPLGTIHQPLAMHVECSPCNLAKCPLDHRCLNELSPERVAEAVGSLLAKAER